MDRVGSITISLIMYSALRRHNRLIIIMLGALAGLLVRLPFLNMLSHDIIGHLGQWYDYIVLNGGMYALGDRFADYTPAYLYLLAAAASLREMTGFTVSIISKVAAIKLPSIAADLVMAVAVYNIVRLSTRSRIAPALGFVIVLILPTVFINSAVWGQADGIYAAAVLWCIYLLCAKRPALAMAVFGIAVSIKLQSIFIAPLLLFLLVRRQLRVTHLLIVPAAYIVMMLPAIALGRPPLEALGSYVIQSGEYQQLSLGAPNLYIFAPAELYQRLVQAGLLVGIVAGIMLASAFIASQREPQSDDILICAMACVMLMPFVLPKMHERYFYLADVMAVMLALRWRRFFWLPIAYQLISLSAYATVLGALAWWNQMLPDVKVFTWLNALIIVMTVPAIILVRVPAEHLKKEQRSVSIALGAGTYAGIVIIIAAMLIPGAYDVPNRVASAGSLFQPATNASILYSEGADSEPLIELVGYSLPQPRTYRTGIMKIYLYFKPLRQVTQAYRLRIDAFALDGRSLELFSEDSAGEEALTMWQTDGLYEMRRFVTIWPTVDAPQLATIQVNWIDPLTGKALQSRCGSTGQASHSVCDARMAVIPIGLDYGAVAAWLHASPIDTFGVGHELTLLDAENKTDAAAGQTIAVTTTWQLARGAAALDDLTFFVHVVSPDGKMLTQYDAPPHTGAYPTHAWHTGEVVIDVAHVVLPADAAAGQYTVQLGVYRSDNQARLPAYHADPARPATHLSDDVVTIGILQIHQ